MITVGSVFTGFCRGWFGRFYGEKVVEGIGPDWIVVREDGRPLIAVFADSAERDAESAEWERVR